MSQALVTTNPKYKAPVFGTPQDRYMTDVAFRQLVDVMERFIHECQYTPSELREAALLAAIHYEQIRIPTTVFFVAAAQEQIEIDLEDVPSGPRLENWYRAGDALAGHIYNDHRGKFNDGDFVYTSPVQEMAEDRSWAQTMNTRYTLGQELALS